MKSIRMRRFALVSLSAVGLLAAWSSVAVAQGTEERGYQSVVVGGGGTGDPGDPSALPFTGFDIGIATVLGLGLALIGIALAVGLGAWRSHKEPAGS